MGKLGPVQEQTMEEILASIRRMIAEGDAPIGEPHLPGARSMEPARSGGNVARLFAEQDDEPPSIDGDAASAERDNVVELAIAQAMEDARAAARSGSAVTLEAEASFTAEPEPSVSGAAPFEPATPDAAGSPANAAADVVGGATASAPPEAEPAASRRQAPADDPWADARMVPTNPAPGLAKLAGSPRQTALPQQAAGGVSAPSEPLLSARADAVVNGAFNQLATTMLSGSARTVDELVEDLLRPMLRSWLDANLPPLVERLVREEIERVSRGRR